MTNGREESNGPRQNVGSKNSKGKSADDLNQNPILKLDKKTRKIKKNKEKEVKITVTKKLNRREIPNDKKQEGIKRSKGDKKQSKEKIRKILNDSKEF